VKKKKSKKLHQQQPPFKSSAHGTRHAQLASLHDAFAGLSPPQRSRSNDNKETE
jgi:hypothetical protein